MADEKHSDAPKDADVRMEWISTRVCTNMGVPEAKVGKMIQSDENKYVSCQ